MDAPSQPKFCHTYAECLFAEEQHHELAAENARLKRQLVILQKAAIYFAKRLK